jgi:N-acetylneuraminic acid mutarotase
LKKAPVDEVAPLTVSRHHSTVPGQQITLAFARSLRVFVWLLAAGCLSVAQARAQPTEFGGLLVSLNGAAFGPGQTMTVTGRLTPGTIPSPVDAYIVVQLPTGQYLSLQLGGGLVQGIVPIARAFVPFAYDSALASYTFNGAEPAGRYTWYAALTRPGTLQLLTPLQQVIATFDSTPAGQGSWAMLAPMPAARQEIASAVLNGLVYVIGGFDSAGQSTSSVFVYNPQANTWSTVAPLPIVNNHGAAAVANGRLFAFGGVSNRAFVYDPAGDSWSEVAAMSFEHGNTAAVAVINDKIYVAGGTGGTQREVEVYDPVANAWTLLAPMSVGRNHCAGGTIGGRFYVVGGRGFAESDTALEVYDPAANSWTLRTPMPTGRSGIGAGVVNNRLYVFGGEIPSLHNEVESYDPVSNSWQQLPPMPTPKHGIWASVIGSTVYLPGGATAQGLGATTSQESFTVR